MQQSGGLLLTPVQTLVATLICESLRRATLKCIMQNAYWLIAQQNMVGVVQLAEHRIVVPGVVGSSPITHPIKNKDTFWYPCFLFWVGWDTKNSNAICRGKPGLHFPQDDGGAIGEIQFYAVVSVLRNGGIPLVVDPAKAAVAEIVS